MTKRTPRTSPAVGATTNPPTTAGAAPVPASPAGAGAAASAGDVLNATRAGLEDCTTAELEVLNDAARREVFGSDAAALLYLTAIALELEARTAAEAPPE
jgi:hypothetical protein